MCSATNRRLYTEEQTREFIGLRNTASHPTRFVAYCRVSSAAQKQDLANQRKFVEEYVVAKGLRNYRKKLDEALKKDVEHDLSD
uniref:recombinase family protein n=1 Tax=Candidatus Methylacidiphilum infernorum TaxID=511746 RepID=UPI001EE5C1A0|nr:recombinase family protein [Candidatus Methylacidiphilum infernorum]